MALLILGQEHLGRVLKKCMELKRVYLHKQQAKQLGDYINVQKREITPYQSARVPLGA